MLDVLEDVALEVSEGVEVDVQRVVMAVGRFLNGGVVPSGGVHVVGPGLHLVGNGAEAGGAFAGQTADKLVDNGDRLCTGQGILRSEHVVALALKDAEHVQEADVLVSEAAVEILEDEAADGLVDLDHEQLRDHRRKLLAGHNGVRIEAAVTHADQNIGLGHHGDGFVSPVVLADVDEGLAGLLRILCLGLVGHELENDLRGFRTGERVVRADKAVRVAGDVRIMIGVLQADTERRVNGDDIHVQSLADRDSRRGLERQAGLLLRPGGGHGVGLQALILGEDGNAVGSDLGSDDRVAVLVVENDLSTLREHAPRGLDDDQIVGQFGKDIGDDAGGFRRDLLDRSGDNLFRCNVFIGCKSHDRQQADDHDQSEKHAEQFAGFLHSFHSFDRLHKRRFAGSRVKQPAAYTYGHSIHVPMGKVKLWKQCAQRSSAHLRHHRAQSVNGRSVNCRNFYSEQIPC